MNQIAILSDERKKLKVVSARFDAELERRMKEMQEYKQEA